MHCQKFNQKGLSNLFSHFERRNNKYRKYNNENINKEKTYLNYNLAPTHEEGLYNFTKNRVQELNICKRKNAVWCCDWAVSAPKDIVGDYEKCKEFFQKTYNFLSNRYGEENVICAYAHFDEGLKNDETKDLLFNSAHLHFSFVPVVKQDVCEFDVQKGELITRQIEKVIAKEVINRNELKVIHSDFQRYLDNELSFNANVNSGITKGGNMTVEQMKKMSNLKNEIKENEKLLNEMQSTIGIISRNFLTLDANMGMYLKRWHEEEENIKMEIQKITKQINNILQSYDYCFSEMNEQLEQRNNRINNIDLSYDKSLTIIKEVEKLNREVEELEKKNEESFERFKKISEELKEKYDKNIDDELEM